jgi:hypothetical protein
MHHLSDFYDTRIYLSVVLRACPSITTDWYGYLPASPHRLTTTHPGPTQPVAVFSLERDPIGHPLGG